MTETDVEIDNLGTQGVTEVKVAFKIIAEILEIGETIEDRKKKPTREMIGSVESVETQISRLEPNVIVVRRQNAAIVEDRQSNGAETIEGLGTEKKNHSRGPEIGNVEAVER